MVDITNKLLNRGIDSVNKAIPAERNNFLPDIPAPNLDVALPVSVLNSLNSTFTQSKTVINNERRRIDESTDALKVANKEINDANKQIQAVDANPLLDILGLFDEDYSRKFQRGRIDSAKRNLQMTQKEQELERQREALNLKEAGLPTDMYKQQMAFMAQKLNLSVAQSNAMIQSNAARKQARSMLQQEYTDEELTKMQKSGEYDNIWSAGEVSSYLAKKDDIKLDFESKQLANANKRLDLADKLEARALSQLPIPWAKSLLAQSEKDKTSLILIPGTKTTVTKSKLQTVLANKQEEQQKAMATTAEAQLRMVKNEGEWSSAMTNVQTVSSIFSGDGSNLDNMKNLNLLNITEETIQNFPIESLHPTLRADFQTVLAAGAILNEKQENKQPVTTQDIYTFKQTVLDLNKKAAEVQKEIVETTSDKGHKAGLREWFAMGQMQTQDNSAAVLVANSITTPNLGNDQALSASYQVLNENLAQDIIGEDINLADLEPEERTRKIFESLLSDNFKGKVASRDKILKALNTKNAKGVSPVGAYISNRTIEITSQAMSKLAEKYPEYKDYFTALGRETQFKNPSQLAGALAELSFDIKQKKPETADLILNNELIASMGEIIEAQKKKWDSQLNPVRGSLMNLMFNNNPSILIDDALSTTFGASSRKAWTVLPEEKERARIARHVRGDIDFGTRKSTDVFSPVPLPTQQGR